MHLKSIAPTGGTPSLLDVLTYFAHSKNRDAGSLTKELSDRLIEFYGSCSVSFSASGTQSLALLLSAMRRACGCRRVLTGAYSCPDIVSASLWAGLDVYLIDVDPHSLEVRVEDVPEVFLDSSSIWICSNLYGLADSIDHLAQTEVFLVDDACQSALTCEHGCSRLGLRNDAFGLISFGRGKAVPGVGGGAVLVSPSSRCADLVLQELVPNCLSLSQSSQIKALVKGIAFSLGESPLIFNLIRHLPWLEIGKTKVAHNLHPHHIAHSQLVWALKALDMASERKSISDGKCRDWRNALNHTELFFPSERASSSAYDLGLIRYPVIFKNEAHADAAFKRLDDLGLGASRSYPLPLDRFFIGDERVKTIGDMRGARDVANKILTLPLHSHVTVTDIECAARVINKTISGD